ncbi:hypothetical protein BGW36DRAFT_459197 [Talaromyces proteolyticus]|uniref:DUF1770-domain-containing protein n=1 Tax=Talaromyces proteolyticus TaxID=1131652 RepID=A0AAD4Q460_9EURO|nr:uncharacterized protein BGW36DRAFT_459197 [Talaromyces proteolyticus]KAH8702503.1 hypothetical protein BGW36DRAFT_459197 [Talaromyces proteolyticus]
MSHSHSALGIAETIQAASIKRHPDPAHDINPATAASAKEPYNVAHSDDTASIPSDIVDPGRVIHPVPRRANLPPLPDLRFEQSYLASIKNAESWKQVTWITVRDQVLFPLIQGTVWTLALLGWRFWNRNAQLQGTSLGTRLRRWWYEVNNWPIQNIKSDKKLAQRVGDFYTTQISNEQ